MFTYGTIENNIKHKTMDSEKIISLIIALAVFLVVREGFQLRDRIEWSKALSRTWHWFGFLMRLMIAGIMFQVSGSWLLTGLIAVILWPVYNISCNIGLKKKWYYLSKSGIDLILRKVFFFVNFDK